MAKEIRIKRVESLIRSDISNIIQNELREEGIKGIVSVFDIQISKDLRYANVKISIFSEDEGSLKSTIISLIKAKSFIRRRLSKLLRTMYVPEIHFEFIDLSESMRVYKILEEIEKKEKKDEDN
ncbi:MAG: 30S ribosome-binding factor RbfA [Brevinematia bacterium]